MYQAYRGVPRLIDGVAIQWHTGFTSPGTVQLSCPNPAEHFTHVDFADIGSPTGECGAFVSSPACHGQAGEAASVVAKACVGMASCKIAPNTAVLNPANPNICDGVVKRTALQLHCGTTTPVPPSPTPPAPPDPPTPPTPPPPGPGDQCAGPFGKDLPPFLQNRCGNFDLLLFILLLFRPALTIYPLYIYDPTRAMRCTIRGAHC